MYPVQFLPSRRTPSFRVKRSVEFVRHETSDNGPPGALSAVLVEDEDEDLLVQPLLLLDVDSTAFDMLTEGGSSMTGLSVDVGVGVGRTDMPHACSSTVGGLLWRISILVLVLVLDAVAVVQAADCSCCCCPE
jgi:hypothetical protein